MTFRSTGSLILLSIGLLGAGAPEAEERVYGKGVSDPEDLTLISELLEAPDKYLGETVRVEGAVVGVCKKRGCWMELASDKEFQTIQIKVEDGEIVFPMEIMGDAAIAEGVFTALPLTLEQSRRYMKHEAECQGGTFDPETVQEAMTLYRIQGTGALVRELETEAAPEPVAAPPEPATAPDAPEPTPAPEPVEAETPET
jgi:hypothetical protein